VGSLFISIGLFCSSLTRSQIVAAVATAATLFVITIIPWWASGKLLSPTWTKILDQCVFKRYTDFSRGIIDVGHLTFFILTTAVFLFLTTKVLESRRWK
jgi:ABC-2 type transport system permease protein